MSESPLDAIEQLLASERIAECRQGLELAEQLLAQGERMDPLLAVLECQAKRHRYYTIQTAAAELVDHYRPRPQAACAPLAPEERRYIFFVTCGRGHRSYYDRRVLCHAEESLARPLDGKRRVYLRCNTPGCEEVMVVEIDCEEC